MGEVEEKKKGFPMMYVIVGLTAVFFTLWLTSLVFSNITPQINNDIKLQNVTVDIKFKDIGTPLSKTYQGIIIGADRNGNSTKLSFADGFIADSRGNIFNDPTQMLTVNTKVLIDYTQADPVCEATVTFQNGTKIIGYTEMLNSTKFNILRGNVDDICIGGQVLKSATNMKIIP